MPTLDELLDDATREALRAALAAASGNVTRAAEALGISAPTAHRHIERLGLRAWLTAAHPRADRRSVDRAGKKTTRPR